MKDLMSAISIRKHFRSFDNLRTLLKIRHKLVGIIVLALCAVVASCDMWMEIKMYCQPNLDWVKALLELPIRGKPSLLA